LVSFSVACPAVARIESLRADPHTNFISCRPNHTEDEGSPVANIKSQIKRNKQNEKRHERNKAVKTSLKTAVRKFRQAAEAGDKDAASTFGREAARKLDKAVSKGVIHKNQAANRKSAIAKKAASL
jgi:small subunit ribosomal protein S20